MSRYSGKQDNSGPKGGRPNKGVTKATRAQKREESEERNVATPVERTRKYRLANIEK